MTYTTAALAVSPTLNAQVLWGAAVLIAYLVGLTYVAKQESLKEVRNLWPVVFLAAPAAWGLACAKLIPSVWAFLALYVAWALYALSFLFRRSGRQIGKAVVRFIAGISIVDALLVASTGRPVLALCLCAGLVATLAFQRFVKGT